MSYAHSRNHDYRQNDYYSDAQRNDQQREREYYTNERGGQLSANYPQFGAAEGRQFQGNDEQYGQRHEQFGPAYRADPSYSYRYGSPSRFYPQHAGNHEDNRYYTGYPAYERDSRFFGSYHPDPVGMVRHGYPDFYGMDNADFDVSAHRQRYPAHSPRYLGGARHYEWNQAPRDWELTAFAGEGHHGGRGGWNQDATGSESEPHVHERHFDPDYHQWRQDQIRNLDRDYDDWRRERYDKFSSDFNTWRSNRPAQDSQRSSAVSDLKEKTHGGSASPATAAGIKK